MSKYEEAEDAVFDLITVACRKRSRRLARAALDAARALTGIVYPTREAVHAPAMQHMIRRATPR